MLNANHFDDKSIENSLRFQTISEAGKRREFKIILLLSLLHIPLGILLYRVGGFAVIHPLAAFSLGIYWALRKQTRIETVACVAAYMVSAEILWRMADVPVFWESGKYGAAVIMITALLARRLYKIPLLPLIYFATLLPACAMSLTIYSLSQAKDKLSFDMSGPFLLFISCCFFSHVKLNAFALKRFLFVITIPLISVGCSTLFYTVSTSDIQFNNESNFATSGGFGPNQVSALLGLGAFAGITCFLLIKHDLKNKIYLFALIIFLSAQSVMTFSRGGMYVAVGAASVVVLFQLQSLSAAIKRLGPLLIIVVLFLTLVFPLLNNFTGGKLLERFEETKTTARYEIAESDLNIFLENPLFGVGVGESFNARIKFFNRRTASHTEFTRLLAEHGLLGAIAILAMLAMIIINISRQNAAIGRAIVGGAAIWAVLFMASMGMRLAAPAFMWGLTFVTIQVSSKRVLRRRVKPVIKKRIENPTKNVSVLPI